MIWVLRKLAEVVQKMRPKKLSGGPTKDPLSYVGEAVANTNRRTLPELLMSCSERRRVRSWQAGGFSKGNLQHCAAVIPVPVVLRKKISPASRNDRRGESLKLMKKESKICRHDMGVQGRQEQGGFSRRQRWGAFIWDVLVHLVQEQRVQGAGLRV